MQGFSHKKSAEALFLLFVTKYCPHEVAFSFHPLVVRSLFLGSWLVITLPTTYPRPTFEFCPLGRIVFDNNFAVTIWQFDNFYYKCLIYCFLCYVIKLPNCHIVILLLSSFTGESDSPCSPARSFFYVFFFK